MIYLDNAATTMPSEAAKNAMLAAAEKFGNPSSLYGLGLEAEKLINGSRTTIASVLGVDKKEIFFTSGGTEANNMAVFGAAYARQKRGRHIVTTKIEHPSVLECFKRLEQEGFEVTYLDVTPEGVPEISMLDDILREDTILVSIMYVNNETGMITPVEKIKPIMRKLSPNAILHCDCVQAFGKIPVKPKVWGADMISISSHKIHGYKGTGALYIKNGIKLRPIICGGEQQEEIRPGTENVGGILAFGAAASECDTDNFSLAEFRKKFKNRILDSIDNVEINGADENNSGSVINISFLGIKSEILLHALERYEIYVSTGSACSSHKPSPSHVLAAMGKSREAIASAVRISFDKPLSDEDMEYTVESIKKEVENIRRYM